MRKQFIISCRNAYHAKKVIDEFVTLMDRYPELCRINRRRRIIHAGNTKIRFVDRHKKDWRKYTKNKLHRVVCLMTGDRFITEFRMFLWETHDVSDPMMFLQYGI